MSDEKDDNITSADFGKSNIDVKKRVVICRHTNVELDEESRRVFCAICNTELDPFTVLLSFALKERSLKYSQEKLSALKTKIDELKREERNVKNRISAAKKKQVQNEQ